jgi:hypothetical protein
MNPEDLDAATILNVGLQARIVVYRDASGKGFFRGWSGSPPDGVLGAWNRTRIPFGNDKQKMRQARELRLRENGSQAVFQPIYFTAEAVPLGEPDLIEVS